MDSLAETMEKERQRLLTVLEDIATKRYALDQEESTVKIELSGIQAYLDAKMGKVIIRQADNAPKAPKERKERSPRKVGIKLQVLEVITPESITKQDILAKLGATDDKTMQQAISNALVALKADGYIVSEERGSYKLSPKDAVVDTPPPAEPAKPKRVKKEEAAT